MFTLRGAGIVEGEFEAQNRVVGVPALKDNALVQFVGSGNELVFEPGAKFSGRISFRGSNARVQIGKRSLFRGMMSLGSECEIKLGEKIYCGVSAYFTTAEGASIVLGDDLLISDRVQIRADDSHPIYDAASGDRINPSQTIEIGNHVWVGADAAILPGSRIADGCVVALRSVVTKSTPVESSCVLVGHPARVGRRGIHWVRDHLQNSPHIAPSIEPILV